MTLMKTQGVRLDQSERKRLKALGETRDRSMNYLIREAVDRYLDDEAQYEKEKNEDKKRFKSYLKTETSISHKQMTTWQQKKASEILGIPLKSHEFEGDA